MSEKHSPMNGPETKCDIVIRRLAPCDIDAVSEIERVSYPDPWSKNMFKKELQLDFSYFFVATVLSEVAAYICFWRVDDEAHLMNITVAEKYRRKGIGGKMLEYVFAVARRLKVKKMYLEVRENNSTAAGFYEKSGFRKIGVRKKYYSKKDNAAVMEKFL